MYRMIKSFRDRETARVFRQQVSRRLPGDMQRIAYRKLVQIDAATRLETLRIPPGKSTGSAEREPQRTAQYPDQ
jgi:toxin HigB-1